MVNFNISNQLPFSEFVYYRNNEEINMSEELISLFRIQSVFYYL